MEILENEKKSYRIIKNILWPFKSTIEIGPDGISNGSKYIRWDEVEGYGAHIQSVNRGMNYIIGIDGKNGSTMSISIVHSVMAPKKKKNMFAEIYNRAIYYLNNNVTLPKVEKYFEQINNGGTVEVGGVKISKENIEFSKGIMKKELISLPLEDVELEKPDNAGFFKLSSKSDKKKSQSFSYTGLECRELLRVLEKTLGLPVTTELY